MKYILDHSIINKDPKQYHFNVSGIINDPKPKFANTKINLLAFANSGNETTQEELNCNIIDIINSSYVLNCEGNKKSSYDLQNAISIIKDELLIINFDEGAISNVSFEQKSKGNRFYLSKGNGLSAGAIVIIVLAILVACAGLITAFVCIRKKSNPEKIEIESSIEKIKN